MAKVIKVDPKKREERAKLAQIELCWQQREEQIKKYQRRNPFSYRQWIKAFLTGALRQQGLGYWSFPSPATHFRKLWETSDEPWFVEWRAESKRKHKKFLKSLKKRR